MKSTKSDKAFYTINYIFLGFILVIVLYPLVYIIACSFSHPQSVIGGKVFLWPVDFTLIGYTAIFENKDVMTGYLNSFIYTAAGTSLAICMTMLAAYPLSRKSFSLAGPIMMIFTFTMFFGGGLIPSYLLVSSLGMVNTRAVMIIPMALSVYNIILTRTFIKSTIPDELYDAGYIDGCSEFRFFLSIVLPLSKAIIAVIGLYYAVSYWNSYFFALIYLQDRAKYPLQLILREILIQNKMVAESLVDMSTLSPAEIDARQARFELLKYSLIIVASVPVMCVYPFVQRYFVKGVMIGAIKG